MSYTGTPPGSSSHAGKETALPVGMAAPDAAPPHAAPRPQRSARPRWAATAFSRTEVSAVGNAKMPPHQTPAASTSGKNGRRPK
eukprot:7712694-Prorocentrum_lima.AAC.1